jgi:hypothetical protein
MVVSTIVNSSIFVRPSRSTAPCRFAGMRRRVAAGVYSVVRREHLRRAHRHAHAPAGFFLRDVSPAASGFLWLGDVLSMHSGIIAAIAMVFGRYAATIVPMGDLGIRVTAVLGHRAVCDQLRRCPASARCRPLTMAKLGAIALLLALLFGAESHAPAAAGGLQSEASGVVAGLFAFGGWHGPTPRRRHFSSRARTIRAR